MTRNAKFKQLLTELKVIQPYQLSTYTLSCAIKVLQEHNRIRDAITQIENEKQKLYLLFEELHIKYLKTETNFVLMYLGSFVNEFIQYSLANGVIVVSTEHYGLSDYVRVSIGNAEDMNEFADIVKKYWSVSR